MGEACLHLQFTIAYRREVLRIDQMVPILKIYLNSAAQKMGVEISALEAGPDHIHIFLTNWKNYSIPELVQRLKGFSSRMIRKRYSHLIKSYLWGDKFWGSGYFYRTVGSTTAENIERYITDGQDKHWD